MHSARIASYPCRIKRGAPNWTISFRDVPQALAGGRGVAENFEVAESALVAALETLRAGSVDGLPAPSVPAPGEVVVTVRLGGPPLLRSWSLGDEPATESPDAAEAADEAAPDDAPDASDATQETALVPVHRQGGFWSRLVGWLTGSRSA